MNIAELKTIDTQLNDMAKQRKILECLDKFYDDNCTFQEANQPMRKGRAAQHAHLSGFFKTLKSFDGATLHAQAVGDNATTAEWTFKMTGPEGPIVWNEILARRWNNGKVVSERFYTAPSA